MKLRDIMIFFAIVFLLLFASGCIDTKESKDINSLPNRFVFTGEIFYVDGANNLRVVVDKETNILYLCGEYDMCPWLDSNGKPMKYGDKNSHI